VRETLTKEELQAHYLDLAERGALVEVALDAIGTIITTEIEALVSKISTQQYDEHTLDMLADLRAWTKIRMKLEFDVAEGGRAKKELSKFIRGE
jgi:hypothetical protein